MRDWKPGDVAILSIGGEEVRAVVDHEDCWVFAGHSYFKSIRVGNDMLIQDARPLVVIDPEDREQVERLTGSIGYHGDADLFADRLQAALREFANPRPPKPEEPTGLGAVVEDDEGERWCRWEIAGRHSRPWSVAGAVRGNRAYEEIAVVRVLSEGVTQ